MIELLKSLFGKKKEEVSLPDPPGRTFKRILSGKYFGCEDASADESSIAKAKQRKINQIAELELLPMFVRYSFKNNSSDREISSAHVVFQKEVSTERWNMAHVTEVSFIVSSADFKEFEKLSGTNLANDFRDLTPVGNTTPYSGGERRRTKRKAIR